MRQDEERGGMFAGQKSEREEKVRGFSSIWLVLLEGARRKYAEFTC